MKSGKLQYEILAKMDKGLFSLFIARGRAYKVQRALNKLLVCIDRAICAESKRPSARMLMALMKALYIRDIFLFT